MGPFIPEDFHFLSPEWFLALIPLAVLLWLTRGRDADQGAWGRVVDDHLLPHLLVQGAGKARRLPLVLLAIGWLIAVVALANPTLERLPIPAFRSSEARVLVLDLSRSMEAPDLEPSRLARARYKVADILQRSRDGQVGLIAFAGDAFVVAPLTEDADTILSMLDALSPEVMPVQGSRPDQGLAKAAELLAQAGATRGQVVLVGDDAGDERALDAAHALIAAGHRLSVIGVGSEEGAPIPDLRDADGLPVLAVLDTPALQELARAGAGVYAPLSADGSDLDRVLPASGMGLDDATEVADMQAEAWRELGPWIALALLPLGALAFRRGWLLGLALILGSGALVPEPALALSWDDLWQRRDQQAAQALDSGDHERALSLAEQPQQRGTASYRLGDYAAAAEAFTGLDTADAHYNRGNALAKAGSLEEAVAAYDQALSRQPGMEDAAYNKARIEELLKQQQEQQQEQQQSQGGEQSEDEQEGEQSADQSEGGQSGQQNTDQGSDSGQQSADQTGQQPGEDQPGEGDGGTEQDQQDQSGAEPPEQAQEDGAAGQEEERTEAQSAPAGEQQPESGADEENQSAQAGESGPEGGETDAPQNSIAEGGSSADSSDDSDPVEGEDREATEQAATDYREEAAQHADGDPEQEAPPSAALAAEGQTPEEREAQQAAERWLRRVPDDPAGLLRRKFLYQYRERAAQNGAVTSGNPW